MVSISTYDNPIYTLNSRDNVMLEVMREQFQLTSDVMHREIQALHVDTQKLLATKGILYTDLKRALTPQTDRRETGFIFDVRKIDSGWYGAEVARFLLPLLDKRTTQSILCGDLLGPSQDLIFEVLDRYMVLARSFDFVHGTTLYCFYINNLTAAAEESLHRELSRISAYLGYVPATYQTIGKAYLSTTLVNAFVKCRERIIMGHEDDRPNSEDVNILGWPFEDFGYRVRSIQSMYSDLFLSFKIERAPFPDLIDTEMSLNAVATDVLPLEEFDVVIDEAKFGYLRKEKIGKLRTAHVDTLTREELESLIKEKIAASYIYNLVFLEQHSVVKFNVIVELPRQGGGYPTRFVAALEYRVADRTLRLITLT